MKQEMNLLLNHPSCSYEDCKFIATNMCWKYKHPKCLIHYQKDYCNVCKTDLTLCWYLAGFIIGIVIACLLQKYVFTYNPSDYSYSMYLQRQQCCGNGPF